MGFELFAVYAVVIMIIFTVLLYYGTIPLFYGNIRRAVRRKRMVVPTSTKHIELNADRQRNYITNNSHTIPILFVPKNYVSDPIKVMYGLKDQLQKRLPNGGLLIRVNETNPPRLIAYMEAYESTACEFAASISNTLGMSWNVVESDRTTVKTGIHKGSWGTFSVKDFPFDLSPGSDSGKSIQVSNTNACGYTVDYLNKNEKAISSEKDNNISTATTYESVQTRLDTVTSDFAAFEFDPIEYCFNRPLLHDLTEPATARFYDAYPEACSLVTNDRELMNDTVYVEKFNKAVSLTETAWKLANENAIQKAEQRADDAALSRARKLMDKALLDSTPEHEASASWKKSLEILGAENSAPTPRAVAKMAKGNPAVDRLVFELESPKLKAITS